MLFILGIVAMPVSAHFTVGEHIATYPFRKNDFDPHVKGLVGYIFPGGGLFTTVGGSLPGAYTGAGTYPGYQSPWPHHMPGPNVFGPAGWYQLESNNYAPFGAILTSTVMAGTPFAKLWNGHLTIEGLSIEHAVKGDLILAFNVTKSQKDEWRRNFPTFRAINFTMAEIMIPPEFSVGLSSKKVVSSITNNYDNVGISTRNREDYVYGPYWRRLRVYTDTFPHLEPADYDWSTDLAPSFWQYSGTRDKGDDAPDSWLQPRGPLAFSPWKTFGNITFALRDAQAADPGTDEWYYIRINDVTAPTIAGAYYFKFRRLFSPDPIIWSDRRARYLPGSVFFPVENYPVVCVKGEVDPAIITGTIRYGGWNTAYYGLPIEVPGRVRAVGIADDPYTGKTTGRPVEARGYFNDTWRGHYEVEGVAPGVYDIYASAAGYPEVKIASKVKILKGQSYHLDGYLTPGVQIKGTVFSKCGTGEVPWDLSGANGNIKIEIYTSLDDALKAEIAGSGGTAVSWSPIDAGAGTWRFLFRYPSTARYVGISFPFFERTTNLGLTKGLENPTAAESLWPNALYRCRADRGVGPTQHWNVAYGLTPSSFDFQFGHKGLYGAPADMVGHVPRRSPVWVNGLGAGTYWARAFLWGYVQTEADGVTFMPVTFTVPSVEWPGDLYIPFDLRRSSYVKKTVHFHDVPGTLMQNPIGWGWKFEGNFIVGYYRTLTAELLDAGGKRFAWSQFYVGVGNSSYPITIRGFRECGVYYGWGRNYGIPAGLYTAKAYMWGYVEQVSEKLNIALCGTEIQISDHLYRGASFNITVYSKDWQHPTADKTWSFPYMPIYLQIFNSAGKQLAPFWWEWTMPMSMQGYGNTSVAIWPYMWNNPWLMIQTHDMYGAVFGQNDPVNYPYYKRDYFGPVPSDNRWAFRKYDGAEHQLLLFTYWYGYGEGATIGRKPLAFESDIYSFKALTYGYIQKKDVSVGIQKGNQTADILIKLVQGAEFDLTIHFKHEGVFAAIPYDAYMRVRVFNDAKKLVGEYLTSDWWWQPQFERGEPISPKPTAAPFTGANYTRYSWNLVQTVAPAFVPAPPGGETAWAWGAAFPNGHRNAWRLNYIPAGTSTVRVVIAGLPDMYNWVGGVSPDPAFDMGYEGNAIAAPYGIDAYPNYKGAYRFEVDIVYIGTRYTGGFPLSAPWYNTVWYPPTRGLLMGESAKYIPENHFGPYELRYDVVAPGTHLGGESSLIFEMDRLGEIYGLIVGYTWCDDWRSTSWTTVQFTAADGTLYNYYTFDGQYVAYLKSGPYSMSVVFWTPAKGEGYKVYTAPFHMSDGAISTFNVYLEQSGVPIPEFPVAAVMLALSLAASLVILRRRRKQ